MRQRLLEATAQSRAVAGIEVNIRSRLEFADAQAALRPDVADPMPWAAGDVRDRRFAVTGEVHGQDVRLIPFDRWRNSWRPAFRGVLRPVAGGSVLEGRITVSPGPELFMRMWLNGACLWICVVLAFGAVHVVQGDLRLVLKAAAFLAFGCVVAGGGLGMRAVALRLADRTADALLDWINVRLAPERAEHVSLSE